MRSAVSSPSPTAVARVARLSVQRLQPLRDQGATGADKNLSRSGPGGRDSGLHAGLAVALAERGSRLPRPYRRDPRAQSRLPWLDGEVHAGISSAETRTAGPAWGCRVTTPSTGSVHRGQPGRGALGRQPLSSPAAARQRPAVSPSQGRVAGADPGPRGLRRDSRCCLRPATTPTTRTAWQARPAVG